jgi:hypothetical protein
MDNKGMGIGFFAFAKWATDRVMSMLVWPTLAVTVVLCILGSLVLSLAWWRKAPNKWTQKQQQEQKR